MKSSKIYHGGSAPQGRGYSSIAINLINDFTILYSAASSDLVAGDLIGFPADWYWPVNTRCHGYSSGGRPYIVKRAIVTLHRFYNNDANNKLQIRLAYLPALGTETNEFTAGDGTVISTIDVSPGIKPAWTFYYSHDSFPNVEVPANKMLFCYIHTSLINDLNGISCYCHCTYLPA